ncbi:MAG: hypothetical protein LUG60_06060 [Erysipelotrichaceae bacterium]|nr:hypothetical protein [Erysipelotrichaceae bacterium]
MNDVELHKPDMNQMSDILKLCVSNLQGSGFSIYYDDMIKNDITLIDVCDLYNDIKTYQINISDLLINDEMIDIFYDNDFDTPVIFGGIGLLEYFDFKNYKEMDASIEEYVDMVFDYD